MQKEPIDYRDINPRWVEKMESSIPKEIMYVGDCDFITEIKKDKEKIYEKAKEIMTSKNLLVNEEKTEYTTVKRGSKEEEREWRNVIKLGSKLGDREDIQRRKELANIALAKNDNLKKELESETNNQNPAVRYSSEEYIVVKLQNLGCVKG